jgi:hydroperoxide lyase
MKGHVLDVLKRSSDDWVDILNTKLDKMWSTIDTDLSSSGSASYRAPLQELAFVFLARCFTGVYPEPDLAKSAPTTLSVWLALQVAPTIHIGKLQPLEEIFLHSFAYPFFLISRGYNKVVKFMETAGKETVERGVTEFKLSQKESLHNLTFVMGFNAFGGLSLLFLALFDRLGADKTGLQERMREEAKSKGGSTLTVDSVSQMDLIHSFVYESLRFNPTVPTQYGRAKKDFLLTSHDAVYEIKKGELLLGFQPVVMRDPKIYENPDTFDCERFTEEKGKELLNYLYWSNGPQTGAPTTSNKMCAAKDMVIFVMCFVLADMLRRYDSIVFDGSKITKVVKSDVV